MALNFSTQSIPFGSASEKTKHENASRNCIPHGPCAIPPRHGQSQLISPVSGLNAPPPPELSSASPSGFGSSLDASRVGCGSSCIDGPCSGAVESEWVIASGDVEVFGVRGTCFALDAAQTPDSLHALHAGKSTEHSQEGAASNAILCPYQELQTKYEVATAEAASTARARGERVDAAVRVEVCRARLKEVLANVLNIVDRWENWQGQSK